MNKRLTILGSVLSVTFLGWICFVHYVGQYEVALRFNKVSGELSLDGPGFYISFPWVFAAKIETTPQRVCVTSVTKTMTCKLARFIPAGYTQFAKREGFRYYWWDNRISFNFGYPDEYRGTRDLIRGYAFSGAKQNFVEVMEDLHE